MRVHHLNCISSCALGGRLMDGRSPSVLTRAQLCCHCLLVETDDSLLLVDTGYGLRDVHDPRARLSGFFLKLLSPEFREELTAFRQIQRLGLDPRDVRHIVLTHLDFDHAGGIDDFPWARVHMLRAERDDAIRQRSWLDRQRFRPQQWSYPGQWTLHECSPGERWLGFEQVCGGQGLPDDVLLLPLPGHTLGHAGVVLRTSTGWQLLAGDAYFHHREMDAKQPSCTPGLRAYQWLMEKDRRARLANQERLRSLRSTHESVDIFCSHDPAEFKRLARRPMGEPVSPLADVESSGLFVRPPATGNGLDRPHA